MKGAGDRLIFGGGASTGYAADSAPRTGMREGTCLPAMSAIGTHEHPEGQP